MIFARIVEAFIDADKEGFDAGVKEAGAVVRMPLFGPAKSATHFACQIGRKFAIVDSVMVAMKMAEMAVEIKNGTGLPIPSRTRNYVLPKQDDWRRVRGAFGLPD